MNENKGIKLLRWAVLLLVFCNIGLLLTIWLKPCGGAAATTPPHPETPRDFVVRELQFTTEQTSRYDTLVKEHQQAMRQLKRDAMEYRQLLFSTLANDRGEGSNPDSLARLIAGNQQQIEMVTYRHFAQVRNLCTENQKQEFDKIIGDVLKKMNGDMHPPPGDRQGPPDGHGPPPPDRQRPPGGGPPPPDAP